MHHHPRSLIRSRLLWLALPGLVFLLWGWFNEPAYNNDLRLTVGDHFLTFNDDGRTLGFSFANYVPNRWAAPYLRFARWPRAETRLPEAREDLFPKAVEYTTSDYPIFFRFSANIAYWLLILLYLAALLAIHLWWQRRKSRLITGAQPQPSPSHP